MQVKRKFHFLTLSKCLLRSCSMMKYMLFINIFCGSCDRETRELLRCFFNQKQQKREFFLLGYHAQWHLLLYVLVSAMAFYNTSMKCCLSFEL